MKKRSLMYVLYVILAGVFFFATTGGCTIMKAAVSQPPAHVAVQDLSPAQPAQKSQAHTVQKEKLPPPTRYAPVKPAPEEIVQSAPAGRHSLLPAITVTKDRDVPESAAELEDTVLQCQNFLLSYFGEPRYSGKVIINFTSDPRDNGRMVWKKSQKDTRKIQLNNLNLYRDNASTLWDIIVHEMFHALYQPTALITGAPEFVLEAQASYAQYLAKDYFLQGKPSSNRIYSQLSKKIMSMKCGGDKDLDLNAPFASYGQCSTDKLYLTGALLFANDGNRIPAVTRTLDPSSVSSSVEGWARKNRLNIPSALQKIVGVSGPPRDIARPAKSVVTVSAPTAEELERNKQVQMVLKGLGYYGGAVDGLLGEGSRKAIRQFKFKFRDELELNDVLDEPTLYHLEKEGKRLGIL